MINHVKRTYKQEDKTMTAAETTARQRIAAQNTAQLLDLFDFTEIMNDQNIPTVRGWIMDELEKRNPEAFDAWMDSEDNTPRRFF